MGIFVIYGIVVISFLLTFIAQMFITTTYNHYARLQNKRNISGKDVARYILNKNNLQDVKIEKTNGYLSDHYDPTKKVVCLSKQVYENNSISSVAVAAHECGHVIQDKENYSFFKIRSAIVPIVNFSSHAGYVAIILGLLFSLSELIWIGILSEIVILIFQLVTLPVEIDASRRALNEIKSSNLLLEDEYSSGRKVLIAAALTYVASVLTTILEIARLLFMFKDND